MAFSPLPPTLASRRAIQAVSVPVPWRCSFVRIHRCLASSAGVWYRLLLHLLHELLLWVVQRRETRVLRLLLLLLLLLLVEAPPLWIRRQHARL